MSLKQRLIGNRRGRLPIQEPIESPQVEDGGTVHRLTAENSWLKTVAKSMVKRAFKKENPGKVIMAKEEDYVLFSDSHFMAIVDGTFLEWFFELKGCNTEVDAIVDSGMPNTIKEFFDALEVGEAFNWSAGNPYIIQEGDPSPRGVMSNAVYDTKVDLVLSAWGYAVGSGKGSTYYTTWPFVHCIMPPARKKDPHLIAQADPKKSMFVQQDLVRIFGDDYGRLKYTIRADQLDKMDQTNEPFAVWTPDDKIMGVVCRFNSNIKSNDNYRWWQAHLQRR